jgi:heptosyltransferase-1
MSAVVSSDLAEAKRALVIKPSSLGDIVHTLPAVALLKSANPEMEIRWVANSEWVPLLRGNSDLAEVLPFPRAQMRGPLGFVKFLRWSRALRKPSPPDLVIDFQGLLRSGLMAKRSRGRCVIGLSDSREGARYFHGRRVEVDPGAHAVERYLAVPRALGVEVPEDEGELSFKLPQKEPARIPPEGFVLFHPFSRGVGKSLGAAQVHRFCEAITSRPVVLVGRGGPALEGLPEGTLNWIDQTSLPELAWLMARAAFTVSVDSGPAHMAAALGERMLAIHSWSDPLKVGPFRKRAWVWKSGSIARVGEFDVDLAKGEGGLPDLGEMGRIADLVTVAAE